MFGLQIWIWGKNIIKSPSHHIIITMHDISITYYYGDINLDHLVKVMSARSLPSKITHPPPPPDFHTLLALNH